MIHWLTLPDPEERAHAAAALGSLVIRSPAVRLLATARSDFLTRLTALPELGREIAESLFLVRAMGECELREAIVGPALSAGFRFEGEDTVDALVAATQGASGGLPLLQFTLAELWKRRDPVRRLLPATGLEEAGGVTGALARHADGLLETLLPAERRAAQRALMRLVTAEGTRSRRTLEELGGGEREPDGASVRAALDAMVRGGVLVARQSDDGRTAFEIAHEALLEHWNTLRGWLSHDAEQLALRQRVERAAAEWQRVGEHPGALWGAVLLAEVRGLDASALGARERRFLSATRRAARKRRGLAIAAAAFVPLALLGVYAGSWLRAHADLERRIGEHVAAADQAIIAARRLDVETAALRSEALSTYGAIGREQGDQAWARARARSLEVDQTYDEATRDLESAIALEDRATLRAHLGDVTLARLLAVERDGRSTEREALGYRLSFFDLDGSRRAFLAAGGRLTIRSAPTATATLQRYEGGTGRLTLGAPRGLGETPVAAIELAQGSYLLELVAPERAPLRLPFVVERAETVDLILDLPRPESVPEGFVHVPPGAFLFGSDEPDAFRVQNLAHMPLHRASTGAYLIGLREVTFGDWIRYLEALPPDEREDDAEAYATWLDTTGQVPGARLCDEREWERAGRGADGRRFPTGGRLGIEEASISPAEGHDPDGYDPREAGSHPASRSVFGLDDIAGNAAEFSRSVIEHDLLAQKSGSWYQGTSHARLDRREVLAPTTRHPRVGFPLCATPR